MFFKLIPINKTFRLRHMVLPKLLTSVRIELAKFIKTSLHSSNILGLLDKVPEGNRYEYKRKRKLRVQLKKLFSLSSMKSFSALAVLLLVCVFALVQVWAAPAEEAGTNAAVTDSSVADVSAQEQAVKDWYAAYQQYAQHYAQQYARRPLAARDVVPVRAAPWTPPYPPPPTFPPYPPPPTFPPYPPPPTFPPFPPGRGR
ncbi:uncharacterized protein EV154DRAFT_555517 [Mucor mucedo]|uniref:uncharacterized protein n=1 Tax=Mucor mucedo TaxID=29922 RepID=UPI002220FDF0|nr:uncharacterized protein EV154DRAFT_555517 [Mucor mucedo]KAI7878111.1 hypothetical protein EV154DRAFT_555517 [Mucor mucedo]